MGKDPLAQQQGHAGRRISRRGTVIAAGTCTSPNVKAWQGIDLFYYYAFKIFFVFSNAVHGFGPVLGDSNKWHAWQRPRS